MTAEHARTKAVSIRETIGNGYDDFWRSKKRYVVCKGSRASKKSTTAALKIIVRMMQYPKSHALVVRKTMESLRDSCFAQLRWAIDRLGVSAFWKAKVSPIELEYIPTGQKILFRGLDDPLKVTSSRPPCGGRGLKCSVHGNSCRIMIVALHAEGVD